MAKYHHLLPIKKLVLLAIMQQVQTHRQFGLTGLPVYVSWVIFFFLVGGYLFM